MDDDVAGNICLSLFGGGGYGSPMHGLGDSGGFGGGGFGGSVLGGSPWGSQGGRSAGTPGSFGVYGTPSPTFGGGSQYGSPASLGGGSPAALGSPIGAYQFRPSPPPRSRASPGGGGVGSDSGRLSPASRDSTAVLTALHGKGVIENNHWAEGESRPSPPLVCTSVHPQGKSCLGKSCSWIECVCSVRALILKVSHAPISIECLFSMTLLHGGTGPAPIDIWTDRLREWFAFRLLHPLAVGPGRHLHCPQRLPAI